MKFNPPMEKIHSCFLEAWIIKVDGEQVTTNSGKNLWKKKNHASAALKNHCKPYILKITDELRQQDNLTRVAAYRKAEEMYYSWVNDHVEFVRIDGGRCSVD